ncbi:3' exoribonuclease family, domain 1-domain-containing protein [Leucosporidium creatinivorum]|uniref:3' exoribonuclease family, domain 1-domain-containing protein n=1 Tax=Leucosporidium creatinivorum TaxID=106004 RepID=A0A1Y2FYC9_9BASI|nr:3' exoribonuclease family, domain 1-domain-containing protein [Leucosporidium creatinivorum]
MAPRTDRSPTALRPLALSQSLLARADGSTKFSFGNVSVMASITGPTEVRIREELVDKATLEINVRPLRGLAGPSHKAAETLLTSLLAPLILLHLYPRSLLQLTLQTLSSSSTAFSTAFSTSPSSLTPSPSTVTLQSLPPSSAESAARINASMLALVDAGVACKGMLVAVAVAFVEGELRLDPTQREEEMATSRHVFAFSFGVDVGGTEGECVGVDSVGQFEVDELFEAQSLAQTATQAILAFIRKSIETRYGATGAPPPAAVKPAPAMKEEKMELPEEESEGDESMDDA